jgi:predicted  nucleic acid-binding Zn-ribbon protein
MDQSLLKESAQAMTLIRTLMAMRAALERKGKDTRDQDASLQKKLAAAEKEVGEATEGIRSATLSAASSTGLAFHFSTTA